MTGPDDHTGPTTRTPSAGYGFPWAPGFAIPAEDGEDGEEITVDAIDFHLADRIDLVIKADRDATWSPSAMARKVRATTDETRAVLEWMAEHDFVSTTGNGAWTRYGAYRQ